MFHSATFARWFIFGLIAAILGCGSGPKLNKVSGTVKYRGQPVPNMIVTFMPTDGRPGQALTDEEGRFSEVVYDKDNLGLATGDYDVILKWLPTDPPKSPLDPPPTPPAEIQPIVKQYGDFTQPALKVTITEGQRTLDLDLK